MQKKGLSTISVLIVSALFGGISCQSVKKEALDVQHQALANEDIQKKWQNPNSLVADAKQITFVGPKSGEGYFSPDGKYMIFQSERHPGNPFYQMYIMNLETGKTKEVSPGYGKTTCGWIHPSMKKLMFSSTHLDKDWKLKADQEFENRKKAVKARYSWSYDEHYDIFETSIEGKNPRRLTSELGYDAEGAYSPDGKWIVFASNRNGYSQKLSEEDKKIFAQDASYMMDIYIMKADGTQVKQLTTAKGYDGGPFFSADGRKITWRRFSPNGSTAEIYTMNVDGSDQKPVTRLKSMSWAPYFHPSGDYIIFASSVLGYSNFELFIVDSDGKKDPVRVTFSEGFDGLPVFTPDGHQLSWTHRSEKGDSQIMMAAWDDAQARRLLDLPAWKPSSQGLKPQIAEQDIKSWIAYLASPELKGRMTGSAEEVLYSNEIAEKFKSWGLKPYFGNSFIHEFEFTSGVELAEQNSLQFVGAIEQKLEVKKEYIPLSYSATGKVSAAPVVFAGYGIKAPATDKLAAYDSYRGLDVKGKWVIVLNDIPMGVSSELRHHLNTFSRIQHKVTTAKNEGAVGLLVIGEKESELSNIKFEGSLSESSLAVLKIKESALQKFFERSGQNWKQVKSDLDKGNFIPGFDAASVYLKAEINLSFKKSKGRNIAAVLPAGSARQDLIIGAHGDHLGFGQGGSSLAKSDEKGQIHFGADDNASGVSGVMELAHYYSDLNKQKPSLLKKNLVFAIWSAEETGIIGSSAFTKDFSKFKNKSIEDQVQAYINMDMIGRLRDRLMVQGVGSASHWTQLLEEAAIQTGLPLTLQEDPYLPTDSMAFYMVKVPTVTLFTGSHGEYHSPRDRYETLNFSGIVRVLDVVKNLTTVLADNNQPLLKYIKVGSGKKEMEGRSFRVYLGTIPDYSQEGVKGVRISGTSKESPAEVAGLIEKDIIVEFDGKKIENLYDYVYGLQSVKPNAETSVKVMRGGVLKELKITPRLKD